jgi:hypothetical protein
MASVRISNGDKAFKFDINGEENASCSDFTYDEKCHFYTVAKH